MLGGAPAGLVGLVAFAAAASDITAVSVSIADGDIGSAAFDGIFIFADGLIAGKAVANRIARRFVAATESSRAIVRAGDELVDSAGAIRYTDVNTNLVPDEVADDFADAIDLRASDVDLNKGEELYLTQRATLSSRASALSAGEDGLPLEEVLPILARTDGDEELLSRLDPDELTAYRQAQNAGYTDDQAIAVGRWNDPALADVARSCRAGLNSFSADTMVLMASGHSVPIAEVQVGDEVLAWDLATGNTVARDVTATLPHTDWLLEAYFSDGSVMSVTEDHRFWSVTDADWVELQDLDQTDVLLTPDGVTVTVDRLDWDAGETAAAWDLTVAEEHNFFVAGDVAAKPSLVHNMNRFGVACRYEFDADAAERLSAAEAAIGDDALLGRLDRVLDELEELGLADDFYDAIKEVKDVAQLRRILQNSALGEDVVAASLRTGRLERILGHSKFTEAARSTTLDNLTTKIATRQDLDPNKIQAVRDADTEFAAIGIPDDTVVDRWWIYGGSKSQDEWLAAYVQAHKNRTGGAVFEGDALVRAGIARGSANKTYFDFSAVANSGPVASRPGFIPDHAQALAADGTDFLPPKEFGQWKFVEAKDINGTLNAGDTSNVVSQIEWLRRQPQGGQFELYIGENTQLSGPLRESILSARAADDGFSEVSVTVFRRDSVTGEWIEVSVRA